MTDTLSNGRGIAHVRWAIVLLLSFYFAIAIVVESFASVTPEGRAVIRALIVTVAVFSIIVLLFKKDTPKSISLDSHELLARYVVGSRRIPVEEISAFQVLFEPWSAGVTLYLRNGRLVGLADVELEIAQRIAMHLHDLGISRLPDLRFLKGTREVA